MICTWKDCKKEAEYTEKDKNDKEWAYLCEEHHLELENAIEEFVETENPRKMLGCWVKASGGAHKMVYGENNE